MKTSFAKPPAKPAMKKAEIVVEEDTSSESTTALAVAETNAELANVVSTDGQVIGEYTPRDLTYPRMNLVNKTGELSNTFAPGSFLYNKEVVIGDGKKPAIITIKRIAKFYIQDLPYGSGEIPKNFVSLRDVRAAGGVLATDADVEEGSDRYSEAMTCIVLVKSLDKENPLFPFEYNGERYGVAQWLLTKSAYKQTGRKLFTDSQLALRAGIDTAAYELTSSIRTNAQGSWYVPMVKLGAKHDGKFIEFVRGLAG